MEKGSFLKSPFSRDSREFRLEILEFLENSQTVEKKGDSDHFLEILENLDILPILEISPVKRPFRNDPFFRSLLVGCFLSHKSSLQKKRLIEKKAQLKILGLGPSWMRTTCTIIFDIITFLIEKHFKTVTVTLILRQFIQMIF